MTMTKILKEVFLRHMPHLTFRAIITDFQIAGFYTAKYKTSVCHVYGYTFDLWCRNDMNNQLNELIFPTKSLDKAVTFQKVIHVKIM